MYAAFFGLRAPPFRSAPDPRFLWQGPAQRAALDVLTRAIVDRRGLALLVGEPGTGKTLLLRHLVATLPARVRPIVVPRPTAGFAAVDYLLVELGLPVGPAPARAARLARWLQRSPETLALCVDDADLLAPATRDALVGLLGLATRDGRPCVQVVLAGPPSLAARPPSAPAAVARLVALAAREVAPYLRARLTAAGATDADVFTPAAAARLAALSDGVPRALDLIADAALARAAGQQQRRVGAAIVDEAHAALEAPPAASPHADPGDDAIPLVVPPADVAAPRPTRRGRARRGAAVAATTAAPPRPRAWGTLAAGTAAVAAVIALRPVMPHAVARVRQATAAVRHEIASARAPAAPARGDDRRRADVVRDAPPAIDAVAGRPGDAPPDADAGTAPPPAPRPTPAAALDVVDAFRRAWEARDTAALRALLADDAVAQGRRGPDAIAAAYAALFADAQTLEWTQPSAAVEPAPGGVAVRAPFVTAWRTGAGKDESVRGVARWLVAERDGRPRITAIEAVPDAEPTPSAAR